jgi:hypothetical protein
MGASSAEIDQEIRATRGELDETLGVLEQRAARRVRRYAKVAAGLAVGVAVIVAGVVVYRRRKQKSVAKQVDRALFESIRDLPEGLRNKLRKKLPITVVIGERADETGPANPWTAIAAKVGPSLVGSAAGAVMTRLRRAPGEGLAAE